MEPEPQSPLHNSASDPRVILIAVDASGGAPMIVNAGARLARSFPTAVVHIVHVFRTSRFDRARAGTPGPPADAVADAKDHLEFHARSARKVCRNEIRSHFLIGDPVAEVKKVAEEIKTDLLVIGTHDYTGLERFLLGSIAESLMRQVHCSVYVVRPAPHRD
jgi:nucleotide-binding universal stress UspA family protein